MWRLEDLLDLHAEPYDPRSAPVCSDESPSQPVSEVRQPRPVAPGQPMRYDEDRREGTRHVFMCFELRQGRRRVKGTNRRTPPNFAHRMSDLVEIHRAGETLAFSCGVTISEATVQRTTGGLGDPMRPRKWRLWSALTRHCHQR